MEPQISFYCQYQKQLDEKTVQAYRVDLKQFADYMEKEETKICKDSINAYLVMLHKRYKQKSVKRKNGCGKINDWHY